MLTNTTVYGDSGNPVLLLPGGAEPVEGFFPGLVDGLVRSGSRVIVHDRPGTGTSSEAGLLEDAAEHLHGLITQVGLGPVVVVGQSLGGAVALLLAVDFPNDVAGAVLLDPTPINDVKGCAQVERVLKISKALDRVPGLHRPLQAQLLKGMRRSMEGKDLTPEAWEALDRIGMTDIGRLADSVIGLGRLAAAFDPRAVPEIPITIVTADRPAQHSIRRSHEELAAALGVTPISWPNSAHNLQLDHPVETLEVVRELIARVAQTA